MPGALTRGDCILDGVRVTRHPYDVPGWGVGEVWVRDGVVIQHELASESLRREHEAAAARGDDVGVLLVGATCGCGTSRNSMPHP